MPGLSKTERLTLRLQERQSLACPESQIQFGPWKAIAFAPRTSAGTSEGAPSVSEVQLRLSVDAFCERTGKSRAGLLDDLPEEGAVFC